MSNDKKAPATTLEALHEIFAGELSDALKNGMRVMDKEGEVIRAPVNPAYLNVVRQFLKDNNIQAQAVKGNSIDDILKTLEVPSAFAAVDNPDVYDLGQPSERISKFYH